MESLSLEKLQLPSSPFVVASDFDETMTTKGSFPGEVLTSLQKLYEKNLHLILVTGRPAGWCDFFARFFPIHGVVGENGAVYFSYDRKAQKMYKKVYLTKEDREKAETTYPKIFAEVKKEFPNVELASDQNYRVSDLAIDFCEDAGPYTFEQADEIRKICESFGAKAKVSSIHVNAWFGEFNKAVTLLKVLKDLHIPEKKLFYIGDSPNDEELFSIAEYSVGVRNVENFDLNPKYITQKYSSEGFVEFAQFLLRNLH